MARLNKPRRVSSWEKPAVQFPDEVSSIEQLDELALMVFKAIEDFLAKHAQKVYPWLLLLFSLAFDAILSSYSSKVF